MMLAGSGVSKPDFQDLVARCRGVEMLNCYNGILGRLKFETREQGQAEI